MRPPISTDGGKLSAMHRAPRCKSEAGGRSIPAIGASRRYSGQSLVSLLQGLLGASPIEIPRNSGYVSLGIQLSNNHFGTVQQTFRAFTAFRLGLTVYACIVLPSSSRFYVEKNEL